MYIMYGGSNNKTLKLNQRIIIYLSNYKRIIKCKTKTKTKEK